MIFPSNPLLPNTRWALFEEFIKKTSHKFLAIQKIDLYNKILRIWKQTLAAALLKVSQNSKHHILSLRTPTPGVQ